MATDFTNNNTTISTSGGVRPTTKNTPLDIRTRVNLKADIDSIPNPFVGMKIIVLQDETNNNQMTEYVVVSLKANNLGATNSKVDEVVLTKDFLGVSENGISEEQAQQLNTAYTHSQSAHVQQSDIPTKTSQLTNDSDFATNASVDEKIANVSTGGSVDLTSYAKKTDLPTKTSQLTNDSGFITEHQDISNKADKSEIPTKTSQLQNDSNFISSIPEEYITETELNSKGYLTEHQDISGKADKSEIPTKTSQLENDSNFATESFVSNKIAEAQLQQGEVDLSGYQTKEDATLETTNKTIVGAINEVNTNIMSKANKSDIPTKTSQLTNDSNYATETFVKTKIAQAQLGEVDSSVFVTQDDLYIDIPDDLYSTNSATLANKPVAVNANSPIFYANSLTYTSYNEERTVKGYQGCTVGVMPPVFDKAVTIYSIEVSQYGGNTDTTPAQFILYDIVKKLPDNAANFVYILTKKKVVGEGNYVKENKLTTISFPEGLVIQPGEILCAVTSVKALGYCATDPDVNFMAYVYEYNTTRANPDVETFELTLASNNAWQGVYTVTYEEGAIGGDTTVPITSVSLNIHDITMNIGDSTTLIATVEPSNATDTSVNWSVDNSNVTVNSEGVVTAVSVGSSIVTVTTNDGSKTDTCNITVQESETPQVTYTITNNLSNATNSNKNTTINENSTYTGTITANSGYEISNVTVVMGGNDITSSVYTNNRINIPSVIGNIVITVSTTVKEISTTRRKITEVVPEMILDIRSLKNNINSGNEFGVRDVRKGDTINKYFVLTVDDIGRQFFDVADRLISIGFYPALALKMESMDGAGKTGITWDELRQLQDMGFEICFHGMLHSHTPAGTAPNNDDILIADIAEFKSLCQQNGIKICGYCAPNHYPLPVGAFKEFEWARSVYGLTSYGWNIDYSNNRRMNDSFASIEAGTSMDWVSAPTQETIQNMINLADHVNLKDNFYLTPMCHTQNLVANIDSYMQVFNGWIAKGLTPMRCCDAVRQSLWDIGYIGNNSTFEIQAGTASNPYWIVGKNGIVRYKLRGE